MEARMSLADEPCRRCRHGRAWLLRPVRERGGGPSLPVEVTRAVAADAYDYHGWYEAIVCAGCGHTSWWARDFHPERAPAVGEPCPDCAATSAWNVDEAMEIFDSDPMVMKVRLARTRWKLSLMLGGSGWNATLAARVCSRCGATAWSCRPEPVYREDIDDGVASPRRCVRCQGPQWHVELSDHFVDQREEPRAVAVAQVAWFFEEVRGRFVGDVCQSCFSLDWYAIHLEQLYEDQKAGVFLIDRAPRDDGAGGPYR
jgi:hypothetical protein